MACRDKKGRIKKGYRLNKGGRCVKVGGRSKRGGKCKCATRDLCIKKLRFVSRMKKGRILKARKQSEARATLTNPRSWF